MILDQGLTQKTLLQYNIDDSRRVPGNVFQREVVLHLPLFLTTDVWLRHEYSLQDIKQTLEYFSSVHLWQCALLHNISASNSAIKVAFATPESMVYGSKAIVIRKIEKMLAVNYNFPKTGSVLDTVREEHIPPIPIHSMDARKWEQLTKMVPDEKTSLLDTIEFTDHFAWKDILMVPVWLEKGAVYAVRIIPKKVFDGSCRVKKPSLSNKPLHILVRGLEFCGVEEACFFCP